MTATQLPASPYAPGVYVLREHPDVERLHDLLEELVSTYSGRVPTGLAPELDLREVHLAWAGSIAIGEPHYYRLQGPRFLAEWDNTQRGANHGHSVWRDPVNDVGLDVLTTHRTSYHWSSERCPPHAPCELRRCP
jgi:hypothetical protein